VLSRQEVYRALSEHYVGLRLDWEQGNHFKDRFGFILGTGDQMILNPDGRVIRPDEVEPGSRPGVLFGRNGLDTTGAVLEKVLTNHGRKGDSTDLRMEWFFWSQQNARRPGGRYPASVDAIAGFARLPVATVQGRLPEALQDPAFLRWHVRQFIWEHREGEGPAQVTIRRVRDGTPEGVELVLGQFEPDAMSKPAFGQALDAAWLTYMKDRPKVARGYLENPFGGWMRGVADIMIREDEEVRRQAQAGTLLAPGRHPGDTVPYAGRP